MTLAVLGPWVRAFVFTQIIEAPIYRRTLNASWTRALLPSTLTHPFVWFAFPALGHALGLGYVSMVVLAELFAWLVEALFFVATRPRVKLGRALLVSLLANGVSLSLGLACRALFGAP